MVGEDFNVTKKSRSSKSANFFLFLKKCVFKSINPIRNNTKYWKFNANVRSLKFI